jgi:hypothetical protein
VRSHRRHSFASSAAQYMRAPREAHASQGSLIVATLSEANEHKRVEVRGVAQYCGVWIPVWIPYRSP